MLAVLDRGGVDGPLLLVVVGDDLVEDNDYVPVLDLGILAVLGDFPGEQGLRVLAGVEGEYPPVFLHNPAGAGCGLDILILGVRQVGQVLSIFSWTPVC